MIQHDGLMALTDDDFSFLREQVDIHALERFPNICDMEELSSDYIPF